jgi:exopolysaccharide biosynthesis predicted pyruvyltransferase EpsI
MKIGIITFHWATNYGAILQAYALQTYLKKSGHDVFIINYRPKQHKKTLIKCFLTPHLYLYFPRLKEFIKEQKLEKFRKKYLRETILYESLDELKTNSPELDIYICGSDQIWNPYFTTMGEGNSTSTYFLDFGSNEVIRIAYAVSFGCEDYPEKAETIAKKYIHNFNAISVRENSGIQIVTKLGFTNAIKLPDPTLLLSCDDYNFEIQNLLPNEKRAVVYILRKETENIKSVVSHLQNDFRIDTIDESLNPDSVESWINKIRNSSLVITNSFHGMVFSLIFHVPFIIILSNGVSSGMNDRFYSLLSILNLEHRISITYDIERLNVLLNEEIDWQEIDLKIKEQRSEATIFFEKY